MLSRLFDFNHPFFRPLWLRVAVVGLAAGWAVLEYLAGSPAWAMLFGALAAVAFHGLFIVFNPREPEPKDRK